MAEQLDDLVIRFPARSGYLAISRLNATAMAASLGFDVEQLDDLRLAVDEAVTWLLADNDASGSVELLISCQPDRIEVRGTRSDPDLPTRELNDLIEAIFGATVDHHEMGSDERGRRFIVLTKRTATDG